MDELAIVMDESVFISVYFWVELNLAIGYLKASSNSDSLSARHLRLLYIKLKAEMQLWCEPGH